MPQYFNLGHGIKPLPQSNHFPWPFDIDLCFDGVSHPIAFSEGVGHGATGSVVSAEDALTSKWKEHFEIAKAVWLIPYIEQLAYGVPLPREEIMARFYSLNGRFPDSYESKFI